MTISVVITCYNLEQFIESAIHSVLAQTVYPNEIIVVDDCSIDNSAAIIKQHAEKLTYIRMPENSGVLQATLVGIKASSGDILTFLDGDDVWLPTKLEEVKTAFGQDASIMMISHSYSIVNGKGELTGETDLTLQNLDFITKDNPDTELLSERIKNSILAYKGIWLGSAYCFKRSVFNTPKFEEFVTSFPYPDFKRFCYQDHPIAQFIILDNPQTSKVFLINKALFHYRRFGYNSSGISNTVKNALKTIKKSYTNMTLTHTLVSKYPHLKEAQEQQQFLMDELRYLNSLYTKKYTSAIVQFVKLSRAWKFHKTVKEAKRLGGVMILGPNNFLAFKSRK